MFGGTKEDRMNALWGKGERAGSRGAKVRTRVGVLATLVAALALAAPMTASADDFTYVAPTLDTSYVEGTSDETLVLDDAAWAEVAWAEVAWAE